MWLVFAWLCFAAAATPPRFLISLSTTTSADYLFNLPIVCELWYQRSGAQCLVQILGTTSADLAQPRVAVVAEALRQSGALFRLHSFAVHVDARAVIPLSQLARVYASLYDDFDGEMLDTFLTTVDVDMWPG